MIKVVVLHPHADTQYNREEHIHFTKAIPGLKKFTISEVMTDPVTGDAPPYNLINTIYFDDLESYERAFRSREVEVAKADVFHFADLATAVTLVTVEEDVPL